MLACLIGMIYLDQSLLIGLIDGPIAKVVNLILLINELSNIQKPFFSLKHNKTCLSRKKS